MLQNPKPVKGSQELCPACHGFPPAPVLKFIHEWQQVGMGVRLTVFTIMSPLKPKFWP